MSRIKFMNIELDNLTFNEALEKIDCLIHEDIKAYGVTPNIDHIVQVQKDMELLEIYRNANLVLTDGKPLLWIAKLYKTPIKEKVSGSDLFPEICKLAAQKGYRIFFLGAAEGVAKKAAQRLQKKHIGLQVVGTYSPPFGFEKDKEEIQKILHMIHEANPHILIMGLGTPKQEKFIYRYREEFGVPFSIGLGASLDFEAGNVRRSPKWMSNMGLEWLYRMVQDPKRLIKRYLIDMIKIIPLIWKYKH